MRTLILAISLTMLLTRVGIASMTFENSYAIVIGIDDYSGTPFDTLTTAVSDAKHVADYFTEEGYDVTLLTNSVATRSNVQRILYRLSKNIDVNDRFLFFFGGHGTTETVRGLDSGFIITYGANNSFDGISMDELVSISDSLSIARHQIFIFNSCFGYSFLNVRSADTPPLTKFPGTWLSEVASRHTRQFISAGGKGQQVLDEGPGGMSYFAYWFLDALKRGWADKHPRDGITTFNELQTELPYRINMPGQTPVFRSFGSGGGGQYLFGSTEGIIKPTPEVERFVRLRSLPRGQSERSAYRAEFLNEYVDPITSDNAYFTIVGSFPSRQKAWDKVISIRSRNPELDADVYEPYQSNQWWGVMMASFTTKQKALEARDIARSRSIASDAYIWTFEQFR